MTQTVENKTVLITGATDGLGKKIALDLASQKARVILHGRSPQKGKTVAEEIRDTSGNPEISYYNADFNGKMRAEPMAQAYDKQARQKLRQLSRELTRPDDAA